MEGTQQALGVLFVLMLLGGTLWWLRSRGLAQFGLKLPGGSGKQRSMKVVERLPLTAQHSLYLVEIEGGTLLVATSPTSCAILDRPPQGVREGSNGR
jgi:flagellar biogenesis protein FliO